MSANPSPPKVFISYSHENPTTRQTVERIAADLTRDGVRVILDTASLRRGNDLYAFMEQMVTDESISRVLIMCDESYQRKADAREAGVGSETMIISPRLYRETNQTRFIPIFLEKNAAGEFCAPAYVDRLYGIDLTGLKRDVEYQELVKAIYGTPGFTLPPLGRAPDYVLEPQSRDAKAESVGTLHALLQDIARSLESRSPAAKSKCGEFITAFTTALREERLEPSEKAPELSQVILLESLGRLKPLRDLFVDFIRMISIHIGPEDSIDVFRRIRALFEELMVLRRGREVGGGILNDKWTDSLRFFSREMFLYVAATFIKERRFDGIHYLTENCYIYAGSGNPRSRPYSWFDLEPEYMEAAEPGRITVSGYWTFHRADNMFVPRDLLMETEFVLAMILFLSDVEFGECPYWQPRLLVYDEHYEPMTARFLVDARTRDGMEELCTLFKVAGADDLCRRVTRWKEPIMKAFRIGRRQLRLGRFLDWEELYGRTEEFDYFL